MKYSDDIKHITKMIEDYKISVRKTNNENFYNETIFQIISLNNISTQAIVSIANLKNTLKETLNFELNTKQITNEEYNEKIKLLNEI